MQLPKRLRPRGVYHRQFQPGLDLPCWFSDGLKSLDPDLYIVWHPFRVMWDDIMNEYTGSIEDGRFNIHAEHGQENWGFVLTDGTGAPIPKETWHIWRLCDPRGYAHIVEIESETGDYLRLLLDRLYLQATYRLAHGDIAWNRKVLADQEEAKEKGQQAQSNIFEAVQEENSWLTKKAMENMDRGIVAPTNPQHESIISFPNQKKRTKTIRPLEDEDVGLVTP